MSVRLALASFVLLAGAAVPPALSAAAGAQPAGAGPGGLPVAPNAGLPVRRGTFEVAGTTAPITIELDRFDVPRIDAATFEDAAVGLGFMHGQERFFQMDLARRYAAGRLAELAGPAMVGQDRAMRAYGFEALAAEVLAGVSAERRGLLEAYARGVNAGVAALDPAPIEYAALGVEPEPWRPLDGVLVQYALYDFLHFGVEDEVARGILADRVPAALVDFLLTMQGPYEAPMIPGPLDEAPLAFPGPEVVDLRLAGAGGIDGADERLAVRADAPAHPFGPRPATDAADPLDRGLPGSNAWAVAGRFTAHGGAILAGDPHLMLSAPAFWYRAELRWREGEGGDVRTRRALGATLPGVPSIAIGSNERVAWSFVNFTGDFQDLVVIEPVAGDPSRYRVPGGTEAFGVRREVIGVRGGADVEFEVRTTRWGPVWGEDHRGRPLALRWTALDASSSNLALLDLARAPSLERAVAIAGAWRGPAQNAVLAADDGRVAWVVSGALPAREGFDGRFPTSWADGTARWAGELPETFRPGQLDPEGGLVWVANNRTVAIEWAERLGVQWDDGYRAHRIRERLLAMVAADAPIDEDAMRRLQLDARVPVLDRWAEELVGIARRRPDDPAWARAAALAASWSGVAAEDDTAAALLFEFRRAARRAVGRRLVAPFIESGRDRAQAAGVIREAALLAVLEGAPVHLAPRGGWTPVLEGALEEAIAALGGSDDPEGLASAWGSRNAARIRHPLAEVEPALAPLLSMPEHPQAGSYLSVRVSGPRFGASLRLVVSPGRERDGILQLPAGQSGHPFAPGFRSLHESWRRGDPQPLATGPAVAALRLVPGG